MQVPDLGFLFRLPREYGVIVVCESYYITPHTDPVVAEKVGVVRQFAKLYHYPLIMQSPHVPKSAVKWFRNSLAGVRKRYGVHGADAYFHGYYYLLVCTGVRIRDGNPRNG